jgi:YidC/Oxa1 family membrane protein insertase
MEPDCRPDLCPKEYLPVKRKHVLLVFLLLLVALSLGGCGVPRTGVEDVYSTQPEGLWQTLAVWPLAKALIWIAESLAKMGITYYWGWAIILFTVIVKVITLPLTISQMRGMQAQKAIQPRVQELQKKYGNDRNRLAQEQMKLYKEAGVNPTSGCLPLVIQMPILFALYAALVTIGPYLHNAAFFWIPDLSFPNAAVGMSWVMDSFRAGDYLFLISYLILPILLMVSQFAMQKWMTPMPAGNDPQMKSTQQITLVMTFMFGFFTLQVPAGLTLYWVTSNLLQMGQQWYMVNRTTLMKPSAVATVDSTATLVPETPPAKATTKTPTITKATTVKPSSSKSSAVVKRKGDK